MSECPICGKPATSHYRPFCSRRCSDVDLGRWLTEGYSIPDASADEAEGPGPDDTPPKPH